MGSVQRLEPTLCPAFADDPPHRHWFGKAPELERAEPNHLEQIADQAACAVGDDDGAGLRSLLQTGGEMRCLPGHRFLLRRAFAQQVAHHDKTGGDADPGLEPPATRCGDRESSPNGSLCRLFACPRPAEISEDAISQELRDVAFQSRDLCRYRILVGAHDLAQLLRIDTATEVGRADEIDEHECQLTALGRCGRTSRRLIGL